MEASGIIRPLRDPINLIDLVIWGIQQIPHSTLNWFRLGHRWLRQRPWTLASPRHLLDLGNQPMFYTCFRYYKFWLFHYLLCSFSLNQPRSPPDWRWPCYYSHFCVLAVAAFLDVRGHLVLSFWQKAWVICWYGHFYHSWERLIEWSSTSCQGPWRCRMLTCGARCRGVG